jgi:hypothetical protein
MSRQGHSCGVVEQVYSGYVLYTDPHSVFTLKPFESPVSFKFFLFNFLVVVLGFEFKTFYLLGRCFAI